MWRTVAAIVAMLAFLAIAATPASAAGVNVLTLVDGKELIGRVLNDAFRIQTPYALLQLARDDVSSLVFDPTGQGMEAAVLRNEDRLSGFMLTRVIDFEDQSGAVLHLRKEKVRNIALALPAARPRVGMHTLHLRNGDLLSGRIRDRQLTLLTGYGTVEVQTRDVAEIEVWGDVDTRVRVMLETGKRVEGRLEREDLTVQLEMGGTLDVYLGNLERLTGMSVTAQTTAKLAHSKQVNTEGMVFVAAGEFMMGSNEGEEDERPLRRVHIGPFYIDRSEVTNRDFYRFVRESGHRAPGHWKNGIYPPGTEEHPVVYVRFEDAVAYARWAGKRLPSEEEWEKAARGVDGRRYPWGEKPGPNLANTRETGRDGPLPAGSFEAGASPFGAVDMAGNVWEWTDSWYRVRKSKVFKGGSFREPVEKARCAYRSSFDPNLEADDLGFRCALSARGR